MAYAIADDVAERLGRELDDQEAQIVGVRLGDAELLIKARIPTLDAKITAGLILEEVVVMIEADAVLRLIRNLEGFSEEADGTYSYVIDARVASGRLAILDDEWPLLGVRKGVFMLAPKMRMPRYGEGCGCYANPNYDFEGCGCEESGSS